MGCTWESDTGLRSLFHGLYMGVRQFEAFIPWVECGSQMHQEMMSRAP